MTSQADVQSFESMTIAQLKQFIESRGHPSKGKKLHREWIRIAREVQEATDTSDHNTSSSSADVQHKSKFVVCDVVHVDGFAYAVDPETSDTYDIESKNYVGKFENGSLVRV